LGVSTAEAQLQVTIAYRPLSPRDHAMRLSFILAAALAAVAVALPRNPTATPAKGATKVEYVNRAISAVDQMQTWYDTQTGLWQNAWWNSANALTTLADFQASQPDAIESITGVVFPNTLSHAPANPGYANFLDQYYDDELWWALAWIEVYDVTGDTKYLDTASAIFEDAKAAWGTTPCGGGIWWNKHHTYVNAIANELYITTAAKLANRKPNNPSGGYYWDEAVKAYTWFMKSGMINSDNLVNDGLNSSCMNNGIEAFTYNQGVILSGLTEMALSSGDNSYNDLANTLALAGIAHFTDAQGILHEPCEPNSCDGDEGQFKGVFARNIQFMVNRANSMPADAKTKYIQFLQTNADAIWANQQNGEVGLVWSDPLEQQKPATIQTQSSALDMLVAAAAVS
jgi:predicted alpha-1,6-mannanase (GH76 family)